MWLQIQYPRIYRRNILSVLWYRNEFHEIMSYSVALLFNHIGPPARKKKEKKKKETLKCLVVFRSRAVKRDATLIACIKTCDG